jgi:type II secretory pathway pseudopilin PulG
MITTRRSPAETPVRGPAGIALIEILVALALLAIGFLSLVATLAQNARLQRISRERQIAVAGAESMLEELRRSDFASLTEAFGECGTKGPHFDLVGLNRRPEDADGHVGRITFLVDETATDPIAQTFGLPRDLNGDGDACDCAVLSGYRLLPVRIQLEWSGAGGKSHFEVRSVLLGTEESE